MVLCKCCKNVLGDFKDFIVTGNVVDVAVAFVLSVAFRAIVTSCVDNLITPIISIFIESIGLSSGSLENTFFVFKDGPLFDSYDTLEAAQSDGAITFNHGAFIQAMLDFTLLAFACFLIVKAYTSVKKKEEKEERTCHECLEVVNEEAIRCKHCRIMLKPTTPLEIKTTEGGPGETFLQKKHTS